MIPGEAMYESPSAVAWADFAKAGNYDIVLYYTVLYYTIIINQLISTSD